MLLAANDPRRPAPVQRFQALFADFRPDAQAVPLEELYAEDVVFEDPLKRAEGLPALRRHFDKLNANVKTCRFEYAPIFVEDNTAVLTWTLRIDPKIWPRRTIVAEGMTRLSWNPANRIHHQRDHFDAATLVYQHLPFLGPLVRFARRRFT